MRKLFRKQILLLTVLAVFFGCTANGGSKDIVKGLIDVATKSGVAPDKAGASTVDIAAADPDGLEIPAPLKGVKEQILTRRGYAVSYNADTKLPNWVAWRLDASRLEGGVKRPRKAFHEDEDVAEPSHRLGLLQFWLRPRAHVSGRRQQMGQRGDVGVVSVHQYLSAESQSEPWRLERDGECLPPLGTAIRQGVRGVRSGSI